MTTWHHSDLLGWRKQGHINQPVYLFLRNDSFPKMSILYLIPKIHKDLRELPGRTLISTKESLFLIHRLLFAVICLELTFDIKDRGDFLKHIYDIPWCEAYLVITLDASSLYTSIGHEGGLHEVEHFLQTRSVRSSLEVVKMVATD